MARRRSAAGGLLVLAGCWRGVAGDRPSGHPRCNGHGTFDEQWDECACDEGFSGDACEECSSGYAGWPSCVRIPSAATAGGTELDLRYGWGPLCEEVAALRRDPPAFLARLGEPYAARQTLEGRALRSRDVVRGPGSATFWGAVGNCTSGARGPWKLKVDIAAPRDAPKAFAKQHRLVLVFSEDWPVALPLLRFVGKIHTSYVVPPSDGSDRRKQDLHSTEANGLLLRRLQEASVGGVKGRAAADKGPPRHTLRGLLETLHKSLGAPLHASDRSAWGDAAAAFKKEVSTVFRYTSYGHKHPQLFRMGGVADEQMVVPALRAAIAAALAEPTRAGARRRLLESGVIEEILEGSVFSFRVFTDEFCGRLLEEIHHFYGSKLPARRPNSMNNYGIILNDIGLEPLVFAMQDAVIQPLAAILFPEEGGELESHHAFTIRYRGGEDTHLDVHTDDSDITFNVNIFGNYSGAPLVFCGLNGAPDHRHFQTEYQHKLGFAVLHRGRHRHGAEDITAGERMNLVVWSYSPTYRSSTAVERRPDREARRPDVRCVSYTHDRDYAQFKAYPPGKKERFFGRGWCPPRGKEYEGFVPDVPDSAPRAAQGQ